MTAQQAVAPLPICPPLIPGEAFTSWMDRIAFRCQLPLGLLLHRLRVAPSDRYIDMPAHYGLSLTALQISQLAAITGVDADAVAGSLLSAYRDGPLKLAALDQEAAAYPVAEITRQEWVHMARSPYCPDCLRENAGMWKLAWRLPWSFACTHHQVLLNWICPGCQAPTAQPRGDGSARPNFIAQVPTPEHCGSSIAAADNGYAGRAGRAARPCEHNLADSLAVSLDGGAADVLAAQSSLDRLLQAGRHRETWANLRALVSVLMFFGDTSTLADLAPDLTAPLFTIPAVVDAVTAHDLARQSRKAHQQRLRDGGVDHRTGVRQRYGTATPSDPALMAALAPIALRLHGPLSGQSDGEEAVGLQMDGLRLLVALARVDRKQLPLMLAASGAGRSLVERAEQAARATGKFVHATVTQGDLGIDPSAIPSYLWEGEADPFVACLPGTRRDTARKFASLYLVKTLTGDTWQQAAVRLGHPSGPIATLTANLVNRMSQAETQGTFLACAQDVLVRLASGDLATVDYAHRRHVLAGLRVVPAQVLYEAVPAVVSVSRRRCSAAWLWAELTGGHPFEAPAWGNGDASPSEREVYRRYLRTHLPEVREALLAYGVSRLGS